MSNIIAIFKTIKEVVNLFKWIGVAVQKYQDKKIDDHYRIKQERRDRLVAQLKKAKEEKVDDEKIRELHLKLRNLNDGRLRRNTPSEN